MLGLILKSGNSLGGFLSLVIFAGTLFVASLSIIVFSLREQWRIHRSRASKPRTAEPARLTSLDTEFNNA